MAAGRMSVEWPPGQPVHVTNNGTCGGKNAFGIVLIPTAADATKPPGGPDDPTPTDPTNPGTGPNTDPGTTLGGCSTTGGSGAGTLMLLNVNAVLAEVLQAPLRPAEKLARIWPRLALLSAAVPRATTPCRKVRSWNMAAGSTDASRRARL